MSVKWYVADNPLRVGNENEVMEEDRLEERPFKEAFQEFYRLRAEKAEIVEFCERCGHFESHNSWCRVPDEEKDES